jgi:uncharacterized membrane protein
MEISFTAIGALRRRDFTLKGCTSLWMFPIYGSAAFLTPLFHLLKTKPLWIRGSIYMLFFFFAEFCSGLFLQKNKVCPWNYNRSKWNIHQIIRLDYAPLWFFAGLLFEQICTRFPFPKNK